MRSSTLGFAACVGLAAAFPRPQLDLPVDGVHLSPLIPSIPGVTEPLTTNAPPLPILQVPTPALESPDYNGSNIHPKKFGYFWTGSGDNMHKDFLASYSLDDDTFGTLMRVVDVPSSGNSPHHLGILSQPLIRDVADSCQAFLKMAQPSGAVVIYLS